MQPGIDLYDRQVEIQLERLRDAVQGRGSLSAMQAIGRYGKTSTQFRFRDQKGPDGKRWIPSEPAIERGGQTLRRTNRLFRSLTWRATPGEASWGTNVVYARVHQYGIAEVVSVRQHKRRHQVVRPDGSSSLKMVEIPAHRRPMLMHRRPYLGFSLYDRSEIWEILQEHILEATKA
jgi:phage virion morphogenesis protein